MSSSEIIANEGLDPFYLYLHLVQHQGVGQVFLLDAAKDNESSQYQMSLLGVHPLVEIQVKDGVTFVYASEGIDSFLHAKFHEKSIQVNMHLRQPYQSVVSNFVGAIDFCDPMEILEYIRLSLRNLFPDEQVDPFTRGFLGYIGYDAVHYLEDLPKTTTDDRSLPDVRLQLFGTIIQLFEDKIQVTNAEDALDSILSLTEMERLTKASQQIRSVLVHADAKLALEIPPLLDHAMKTSRSPEHTSVYEDVSEATYVENVERAKEYILSGDIFQVVLSKRIRVERTLHPYVVYERLRHVNPSPYMFMVEYPDMKIFGASPEVQFRAIHGIAEMAPIAGTSKGRGITPEEDRKLAEALLNDEKERAEHVMLVDLCRNDLGRVCETGSVHVPEFLIVEPYSHLFHLVSKVKGRLRKDVSVFHALLATFPAGTLSGAPKIRAMQIIDELETYRRGPYGGMIGMIDLDANANTAIVIRTVVDTCEHYYIQVGAGIVADSVPIHEWNECAHKAGALVDVLTGKRLAVSI